MSDVEVRLHITPAELHEFFCDILSKYEIGFLIEDADEYRIQYELSLNEIGKMSASRDLCSVWIKSIQKLKILETQYGKICRDEIYGSLDFVIPNCSGGGLRLCNVSARSNDEEDVALWRRIAGRLRKVAPLHEVEMVSAFDGKRWPFKRHRVTPGAKEVYKEGRRLYELYNDHYYILKD